MSDGPAFDELLRRLTATDDLDIVVDPEPENLGRVADLAVAIGGQVHTREAFVSSRFSIAAMLARGERVEIETTLGATEVEIMGTTIAVCRPHISLDF